MGFSRQEYWSGLPFLSLEELPNPGLKPVSSALQVDSVLSEPPGRPKICDAKDSGGLASIAGISEGFSK